MQSTHGLDATFAALADPTRRAILARLASGEASVTELAQPFAMSQPARLEPKRLAEATAWLERYRRFWERRFQRLDALLDELKTRTRTPGDHRCKAPERCSSSRPGSGTS